MKSTAKKSTENKFLQILEEYFTDEVMARLEEIAREDYSYG